MDIIFYCVEIKYYLPILPVPLPWPCAAARDWMTSAKVAQTVTTAVWPHWVSLSDARRSRSDRSFFNCNKAILKVFVWFFVSYLFFQKMKKKSRRPRKRMRTVNFSFSSLSFTRPPSRSFCPRPTFRALSHPSTLDSRRSPSSWRKRGDYSQRL